MGWCEGELTLVMLQRLHCWHHIVQVMVWHELGAS